MEFKHNLRGFYVGEFKDAANTPCSIQESSLGTEAAIWLGVDEVNPRRLTDNGWEPVPFPTNVPTNDVFGNPIGFHSDTLFNTRAHLTIQHVKVILTIFEIFQENKLAPTLTFPDRYDIVCTIQQDGEYLSLGPDNADPRICINGWKPVPYPPDTVFTTHMKLDHHHVTELTPLLQRFLETGYLCP